MKLIYFCFLLLLICSATASASMQCNESMLMPKGSSYTWQNHVFEYTDLLESETYPGYFLDPEYTVTPPGLSYRSVYSSGPAWSKITQPSFTIETLFLFGGNQTHNIFCADSELLPTPTPTTPTPTIPVTVTPTATPTGTPTYNGTNGSNSSYPPYYQEDSYQNIANYTLPEDSHGFKELAEGMGYQATVGGYISIAKDYMFFYFLVGLVLFMTKLFGG